MPEVTLDNSRELSLQQRAAVQGVARSHPTSSATQVLRNLGIQETVVHVSPSKHCQVQVHRVVMQVRESVFNRFTSEQRVENSEGLLTRRSASIFFKILVEEHNRGGKHLSLHDLIFLEFPVFKKNSVAVPLFSSEKFHGPKYRALYCIWMGTDGF